MSGPVTMALGGFMFRAHGFGYQGVSRVLDAQWSETETVGTLNTLQWTGPKSEMVTINGVLFPEEFGGLNTLEAMKIAARAGVALMLVSLGGRIFGRHAIQKIDEDRSYHNRTGLPARVAYSMELKRVSTSGLLSTLGVL